MNEYQRRVLQGRRDFLKLVQSQEQELLSIYEEASRQVAYKLSRSKAGSLTSRYLDEVYKSVNQYITELRSKLSITVEDGIEASSQIASAVQLSYFDMLNPRADIKSTFNKMFSQLPANITKQLISADYYSDGKTLDKRLWDITRKNAKDIDTLIKVNISKGTNARELAKQLNSYINPAEKMDIKTRIPGINKDIAYQAQRLARTSLTHANNESFIQGSKMNPFSTGLMWNLSPSHYERQVKRWGEDICDEYSGKVFKSNEYPVAHPNCLCYPTTETIPVEDARDELISWLNGESNDKLDNWLDDYGEEFGLQIPNVEKSQSLIELAASKEENGGIINSKEASDLKDYKEPLAKRHNLNSINKKSVAKDKNTIIMPNVDVHKDIKDIKDGLYTKINDQIKVNERIYGKHDGRFYPVSGEGFITLTRNEYKLLIKLKTEYNNPRVIEFLKNMGADEETINKLIGILKKGGISNG